MPPWSESVDDIPAGNYKGYCIELIQKISEEMNFDYEIVVPKDGRFGDNINGEWNGLIGDLVRWVICKKIVFFLTR